MYTKNTIILCDFYQPTVGRICENCWYERKMKLQKILRKYDLK